jgi:hypothetical protein
MVWKRGSSYFVGSEKVSFTEAAYNCLKRGLKLVSIEAAEEFDLIDSIRKGLVYLKPHYKSKSY